MAKLLGHVNLIGESQPYLNSMTGQHPRALKWHEPKKTTTAVTNVC